MTAHRKLLTTGGSIMLMLPITQAEVIDLLR
jgi:hypothetical protein